MSTKPNLAYFLISRDWMGYADESEPNDGKIPSILQPSNPSEWGTCLRISFNVENVLRLFGIGLEQGARSALEIDNNSSLVGVCGLFGTKGQVGDQVISIKGGSRSIAIGGTIFSSGTRADVVIGDWDKTNTGKSYDLDFTQLKRYDGKPVTFVLGRVDDDQVALPPNGKVLFAKSVRLKACWWIRFIALKAGLNKFNTYSK